MAIIKCIDCGKDISDRSEFCIHCGCPISFSKSSKTQEEMQYSEQAFTTCPVCKKQFPNGALKCDVCLYSVLPSENIKIDNKTIVECPYCQSSNTKKISSASRAASLLTFGFASKKVGKQWHCNKCGSDF